MRLNTHKVIYAHDFIVLPDLGFKQVNESQRQTAFPVFCSQLKSIPNKHINLIELFSV